MVSAVVKTLLLQAFLAFHVQAGLSASDLAKAEDDLNKLLKEEQGEICGSQEINDLLKDASKTSNRLAEWAQIEKIADAELERLEEKMKEAERKISAFKEKLEKKLAAESPGELSYEDAKSFFAAALVAAKFGGNYDEAKSNAQLSQCGYKRNKPVRTRKVSEAQAKLRAERNCQGCSEGYILGSSAGEYHAATSALEKALEQSLTSRTTEAQFNDICKEELGSQPPKSYCNEMCVAMSGAAGKVSFAKFGVTAGKEAKQLQEDLDLWIGLGKAYETKYSKCSGAADTLKAFKKTLAPLEIAIQSTLKAWMNAQESLDQAEEALDTMETNLKSQEETLELAKTEVKVSTEDLQKFIMKSLKLKAHETILNSNKDGTTNKLEKAKTSIETNNEALQAAEKIKEKLEKAMYGMISIYEKFVMEPLNNFGLSGEFWKVFLVSDGEVEAIKSVKESLEALGDFCKTYAIPIFEQIKGVDLSPLCDFGGPEAFDGIEDEVKNRKEDVKEELMKAASYSRDFSLPDSAGERTEILTAPPNLQPLIETYQSTDFAKTYMPDWETGGRFLGAMQALRDLLKGLESETEALKSKIATLSAQLSDNAKIRKEVMEELKAAKQKADLAAEEEKKAHDILIKMEDEAEEQEETIALMYESVDNLYAAYKSACNKFDEVFNAGTIFLQMQELPSHKGIASSASLKTIRRLK